MKTHNGISTAATAPAMLLMASCSMPVQVPRVNWPALGAGDFAQTQPQWLVGPVR